MQESMNSTENPTLNIPTLLVGSSFVADMDPLPEIPAMNVTRLQLELLLQDSSVDLSAVSEVFLSDAGATLQLFRLIGKEYPEGNVRPTRVEDCLVSLSVEHWYEAVCLSSAPYDPCIQDRWQHYRRVAQCARELANRVEGVSPEEAYIVGLLHDVGKFPRLLGWNGCSATTGEDQALGVMLADYWHLPPFLLLAIQEERSTVSSDWSQILQMARELAA